MWRATETTMQIPPDPRRAPTSRPLAAQQSQPTGASRSQPLRPAAPSQPGGYSRSQPLSQPLMSPSSQPASNAPSRLQLSGMIDDRINALSARDRQRAWLVDTVVLAQALITLMVVPGFLIPSVNLPMALTLAVALVFYVAAFLFNRLRHELRVAVYLLIGGGALSTAAQAFVTAFLSHSGAHTAQAALLYLPIILEAGLFLTPELTLVVASVAAVFTASAILLALALSSDSSSQLSEAYLLMVYALGLEAFIGYLAWRLAQFIYETVKSSQADEDLRFAQARLAAAQRQMGEQRRQLGQDVGSIQLAISRALAHEYDAQIEAPEGELASLAPSLNLLIQQLRSTNELERKLQKMESQAVALVEMVGRLASGSAPVSGSDAPTDTALDSVRAALNQAQTLNARRQSRIQEIVAEISDSLKHSREGVGNTGNESARAQQIAGQLVSLAEMLTQTAQRQGDLLAQARRALALALPPELVQHELESGSLRMPTGRDGESDTGLLGLGIDLGIMQSGYTGEFPALEPIDREAAGIPPLTTPLPSVSALTPTAEANDGGATGAAGADLPAGLGDAWLLLTRLNEQTVLEMRAVVHFSQSIGVLGRHLRQSGVGIDWVNQALEAIEIDTERLQRLAGSAGVMLEGDDAGMARPGPTSTLRRAPLATRPLEADARLSPEMEGLLATPSSNPDAQHPATAPGSLRVSELIGLDALGGQGAQSASASSGSLANGRDDADRQSR